MVKLQEYYVVDYVIRVPLKDKNSLKDALVKTFERLEKKQEVSFDNDNKNLDENNKIIFYDEEKKSRNNSVNEEIKINDQEIKEKIVPDELSDNSQKIKVEKMKKITPDGDLDIEKKHINEDEEEAGLSDKKTDDKSPVSVKLEKESKPSNSTSLSYMSKLSSFTYLFLN